MTQADGSSGGSFSVAEQLNSVAVPVRAVGLALVYLATALVGVELTREADMVAAIWPPNAVLLAVLLRGEVRNWPIYTAGCAVANATANLLYGDNPLIASGLALVNMLEVLGAALLLRRACGLPVKLLNIGQFVRFAVIAGMVAPTIGAFAGAALLWLAFDVPFWAVWRVWWVADAMGFLVVAPPLLCFKLRSAGEWPEARDLAEGLLMLLAVVLVTTAVFTQGVLPWLFLIPPILIWAAIRTSLFVTAIAGLMVTVIAISLTVYPAGPIAAIPGITINEQRLYLQLFLGTTVLAPLLIAVALAELKQAGETLAGRSTMLELSNDKLKTVIEQRENLLKELQHRVKNNLQVVVSLLNLRSDRVSDPGARNALLEASNRVEALALAHRNFYRPDSPSAVAMGEYIPELCSKLAAAYSIGANQIDVRTEIENITISLDQATPLALILNELISNVFKHAFPEGRKGSAMITVRSETDDENRTNAHITIRDDGVGMPEAFDLQRVNSTGLKVFLGLLNQIDGHMELERVGGTAFHIRFPLEKEQMAP